MLGQGFFAALNTFIFFFCTIILLAKTTGFRRDMEYNDDVLRYKQEASACVDEYTVYDQKVEDQLAVMNASLHKIWVFLWVYMSIFLIELAILFVVLYITFIPERNRSDNYRPLYEAVKFFKHYMLFN